MANSKLNNSSKLTVTEADICCQPCASGGKVPSLCTLLQLTGCSDQDTAGDHTRNKSQSTKVL